MLSLADSRWSELRHAYGSASDIPALLEQLVGLPSSEGNQEPWFSLWSALAHQEDVYSASFAAVPHVIEALSVSAWSIVRLRALLPKQLTGLEAPSSDSRDFLSPFPAENRLAEQTPRRSSFGNREAGHSAGEASGSDHADVFGRRSIFGCHRYLPIRFS